ncbi:TFIIA-domain-containing protein [Tricholoma matsutake]|nr:TFIIA-domain-containing protein [Tricholoma matsutake 945]
MHIMQQYPYALPPPPGPGQPAVKVEALDNRYMVGMPYGIPALPGPSINGRHLPGPPPHPGGQTGVISFPRPLQPQPPVARPFVPPQSQPQQAPQPPQQPPQQQRIPQVDGPSESSDDEGSSPPASQGQAFAPRTSHPSLPQPAASSKSAPQADSEAINSDLDDSDTEGEEDAEEGTAGETDIVFCTYDKVARVKNKWKCVLKDGMIHINGKDYLFAKCTGEFEW